MERALKLLLDDFRQIISLQGLEVGCPENEFAAPTIESIKQRAITRDWKS